MPVPRLRPATGFTCFIRDSWNLSNSPSNTRRRLRQAPEDADGRVSALRTILVRRGGIGRRQYEFIKNNGLNHIFPSIGQAFIGASGRALTFWCAASSARVAKFDSRTVLACGPTIVPVNGANIDHHRAYTHRNRWGPRGFEPSRIWHSSRCCSPAILQRVT